MDSPISLPASSGRSFHNDFHSGSYSSSKESYSSETSTKADGTSVTKVAYSSEKTSYVVSFSGSTSLQSSSSYTYTQNGEYNQLSSKAGSESAAEEINASQELSKTLSSSSMSSSATISESSPLLDGASNILSFVEQRIANEKANGASEEELADLWEQGLIGFDKGFDEAKQILSASGQLEENIDDTIQQLYDQVKAGFKQIYNEYINNDLVDEGKTDVSKPSVDADTSTLIPEQSSISTINNTSAGSRQLFSSNAANNQSTALNDQFKVIGNMNQSGLKELISSLEVDIIDADVEYGRKDSFDFELTTLEGDVISIKASNTGLYAGNYSASPVSDEQLIEGFKDKNQFEMDIVGELNEQETIAIKDLLNQIMTLADEFYNGDIDKAYEAALELGYDQQEIASYSVNLRQTEQFSVAKAYTDLLPTDKTKPDVQESMEKIGGFAQSVLETLNKPENYQFFDFTQLLRGISEQIDNQIKPTAQQGFVDAIDQLVNTKEAIAKPIQEVVDVV